MKTDHLSEAEVKYLEGIGWQYCQMGPNEWTWLKFDLEGKRVAQAGDMDWQSDLTVFATIGSQEFTVKVYCEGQSGYFAYEVGSSDQACHHAQVIMRDRVYRRVTQAGDMEFWPVYKVKVTGPGLDSEYTDRFVRT